MRSLAAVARAPEKPFSVEYIDLPEPAEDEILVKIAAVGVGFFWNFGARKALLFRNRPPGILRAVFTSGTGATPWSAVRTKSTLSIPACFAAASISFPTT